MDHVSELHIRRQSPHARRRRRHAQQQSACCSCFLLVAFVVLGYAALHGPVTNWRERRAELKQARTEATRQFPLSIAVDAPSYRRYSLAKFTVRLSDHLGRAVSDATPPRITVRHEGKDVETVGGLDRLAPKRQAADGSYVYHWPIPWNAPPGRYEVETTYQLRSPEVWPWITPEEELERRRRSRDEDGDRPRVDGEAVCVARATFDVTATPPPPLPVGMCAATWEPGFPSGPVRTPSGRTGDWRAMFDWCEFIGADTLWVRGAVTQAYTGTLTLDEPFFKPDLDAIPRLAAEAQRRGLKFGVWAMAYNTLPETSNRRKPAYRYAKDISRSTGRISDTSFISLLDGRRIEHLAAFFKAMQDNPNVDHIGLDYMRTEPGYELTDHFARAMPVALPDDWDALERETRWKYIANRVERPGYLHHPEFYEAWNWYRAHLGARVVEAVIRRSQATKPVWIFALSWKHGTQHGQDPLMFTDAGVTMLAQMLYQTDRPLFEVMLKDWPAYIGPDQVNLVCGDQVDDYWHQRMGPQELYRRMVEAHRSFIRDSHTQGGFWHDISRAAVRGNLGPYPGSEWALAGGAAFSAIRETWRVYPIRANLVAPEAATRDVPFRLQLNIENIADRPVRRIRVKPMETEGVVFESPQPTEVAQLGPGQTISMPFTVRLPKKDAARNNRFMTALRITWPAGSYGRRTRPDLPRVIIVMDYVQVN